METKERILFVIVFGILAFLCIVYVGIINSQEEAKVVKPFVTEIKIESSCKGINIYDAVYCLRYKLAEFYNYNLSNANAQLTEEQLKKEGGVCWHYAEWYATQARGLGFYATTIKMQVDENTNHEIALVSKGNVYCRLDQLDVECYE